MSDYAQPKIIVNFNVNGKLKWQNEYAEVAPAKGEYVLYANKAYEVVEVWHIFDQHGPHLHGTNVFLEPTDILETKMGQSEPTYYGG
ncbi:hypothetical protein [Brevibacterium sediminis]|uniref:Uncharacterized protein n=1 Tax=Brevibacterium sediminis TaxID=1857024 RepID=A0A5C4X4V7_9MICO|nr:hypothetical protein [Brevibacterium sediminis]TNM55913.1 hypothetical protein FHQ09_06660 [Brevibacterium sediminis]